MKNISKSLFIIAVSITFLVSCKQNKETKDEETVAVVENSVVSSPLSSWNDGKTKQAIIDYVEDVTNKDGKNFIPVTDRIATFDNDGTLWAEQPAYFQLFFAMDRIKAMASDHPEWKNKQPFKAVLENDMATLQKLGEKGIFEIIMNTHAGMTTDEFETIVKDWTKTAKHPTKDKLYTEMVYQPMLELLDYLRANDFKTFIVSGGGIEFMRPWTESVYGIPKNQVIGSTGKIKYDYNNGSPVIHKLADIDHIDDKVGKPESIQKYIGQKPVFSAGNSDGDLEMLRWADSNTLKSFKLYVHHTDSIREWAYDRNSPIGNFDKGWSEADKKGWTVASIKDDWKVVYPYELK